MSAEIEYRRAFERLKTGKAIHFDKGMPFNRLDTIAIEAGKKKGSLRKSLHRELCEEILNYVTIVDETDIKKEVRLKEQYRAERDEKHQLWTKTLARELMLKIRIEELETEITRIKQNYPGIVFKLDEI